MIPAAAPPVAVPAGDREVDRILALPRRVPVKVDRDPLTGLYAPEAEALADVETARYALAPGEPPAHDLGRKPGTCGCQALGYPCVTRLYPSQAWFLRELRLHGGALGLVTVAGGKTFMNLLGALAVPCRHVLLLIKPDQRHHYRISYLRLREHFRVPSFLFHEGRVGDFDGAVIPDMPVVRALPYSRLQRPESSDLLETSLWDVDLVLADEVHKFCDRTSRTTSRWMRFMVKKLRAGEGVMFAGSSGSAIKKGIGDVAHISLFALGGGSPYPLDQKVAVPAWGAVVDPVRDPDLKSPTYRMLRRAFGRQTAEETPIDSLFGGAVDAIREGILDRVVHTPGVISTRVSETTASITLSEFRVPKMPEKIQRLLADVRQRWVRPDGEEFQEALEAVACAKNVGVGFHYFWFFKNSPDPKLVDAWYAARKAWCKEVRAKILEDVPKLDSPHLLENAARRAYQTPAYDGSLPVWRASTWPAWAAIEHQIDYEPRSCWLDDWFAEACAAWALKNDHGIVWFESAPLGERVAKLSGLALHRGGPRAEERILAERGEKSIVASISAHKESRDGLQHHFWRGLVAELMSSGDGWHQLLGRYCRPGQPADTVELVAPLHTEEFKNALRSAYRYASWKMSPNSQLLLAADPDEGIAECMT